MSDDKVSKHEIRDKPLKPAGKLKLKASSEVYDEESSKVGLTSPKQAQEIALALRLYPVYLG